MTGRTSFFHRFFEALDGEDADSAMQYIADDMEFAILWAPDTGRQSKQFTGGPDELRGFTDAGDHRVGALHPAGVARRNTEIALGETRWEDGRHIGTFLAAAELDEAGRMRRYFVGRSPALRFPS